MGEARRAPPFPILSVGILDEIGGRSTIQENHYMGQYQVIVSDVVKARRETVYAILSDYHEGHPSVLPKPYFKSLTVEEGGVGAGTVAVARMEVYGNKQTIRLHVTEPEPGWVLAEEDASAGICTLFKLEELEERRTLVTISTDFRDSGGLRGFFERIMNPSITRRIYREELALLDKVAHDREAEGGAGFG